ncbi:transposase [Marinobacterium aestuariivivens]|uniref:Transposase n=2 Tax=Marinobacterium aestuariivivens TaxID=1698799 RepID=A0ABW2A3Y3_9GAMM
MQHHLYLITTVTHGRERLFRDFRCGQSLASVLRNEDAHARTLAYVIMPDHLHWLFQLRSDTELHRLMHRIKGISAYRINRLLGRSGSVWQPGYHDHAVRNDEDLRALARYVVANPLRGGLVTSLGDYPFWDAIWL